MLLNCILRQDRKKRLGSKTDSVTSNITYLNNFEIWFKKNSVKELRNWIFDSYTDLEEKVNLGRENIYFDFIEYFKDVK